MCGSRWRRGEVVSGLGVSMAEKGGGEESTEE
jgi:hypothetical protein